MLFALPFDISTSHRRVHRVATPARLDTIAALLVYQRSRVNAVRVLTARLARQCARIARRAGTPLPPAKARVRRAQLGNTLHLNRRPVQRVLLAK